MFDPVAYPRRLTPEQVARAKRGESVGAGESPYSLFSYPLHQRVDTEMLRQQIVADRAGLTDAELRARLEELAEAEYERLRLTPELAQVPDIELRQRAEEFARICS
jgi:hypothetical protein